VQFRAPDDGRKTRMKHVERLTEINKLRKVASYWLYSENILAMHGPMNVTKKGQLTALHILTFMFLESRRKLHLLLKGINYQS